MAGTFPWSSLSMLAAGSQPACRAGLPAGAWVAKEALCPVGPAAMATNAPVDRMRRIMPDHVRYCSDQGMAQGPTACRQ